MTLPQVIRVFFAIDLPEATKEKMGRFIGQLKKHSKTHAIRWSRPENLHITLQFLAEVKTEHVEKIISSVRARLVEGIQRSTLSLSELHVFPSPFRPRVIVLDVMPQDQLSKLSEMIGQGIVDAEYAIEDRPFRGHLTLGRIKQPQGVDLRFLSEFKHPDIDELALNEVVLFRSEPQQDGSRYTALERIAL